MNAFCYYDKVHLNSRTKLYIMCPVQSMKLSPVFIYETYLLIQSAEPNVSPLDN
jgi:hypothetical protein